MSVKGIQEGKKGTLHLSSLVLASGREMVTYSSPRRIKQRNVGEGKFRIRLRHAIRYNLDQRV